MRELEPAVLSRNSFFPSDDTHESDAISSFTAVFSSATPSFLGQACVRNVFRGRRVLPHMPPFDAMTSSTDFPASQTHHQKRRGSVFGSLEKFIKDPGDRATRFHRRPRGVSTEHPETSPPECCSAVFSPSATVFSPAGVRNVFRGRRVFPTCLHSMP